MKTISSWTMKKAACLLTLSTSQTLTVLSAEDVASRGMLGLKRISVIIWECSSSLDLAVKDSVHHNTACIIKSRSKEIDVIFHEMSQKQCYSIQVAKACLLNQYHKTFLVYPSSPFYPAHQWQAVFHLKRSDNIQLYLYLQ